MLSGANYQERYLSLCKAAHQGNHTGSAGSIILCAHGLRVSCWFACTLLICVPYFLLLGCLVVLLALTAEAAEAHMYAIGPRLHMCQFVMWCAQ